MLMIPYVHSGKTTFALNAHKALISTMKEHVLSMMPLAKCPTLIQENVKAVMLDMNCLWIIVV